MSGKKTFGLIIAGSRTYDDYFELQGILDKMLKNQEDVIIITGGAKGADTLGNLYAIERGYDHKVIRADWETYGKRAGMLRNEEMHKVLSEMDVDGKGCICFWDGQSKGTQDNFDRAIRYGEQLKIYNYKSKSFYHYTGKKEETYEQIDMLSYLKDKEEEIER